MHMHLHVSKGFTWLCVLQLVGNDAHAQAQGMQPKANLRARDNMANPIEMLWRELLAGTFGDELQDPRPGGADEPWASDVS